jgi:hypothetical protein
MDQLESIRQLNAAQARDRAGLRFEEIQEAQDAAIDDLRRELRRANRERDEAKARERVAYQLLGSVKAERDAAQLALENLRARLARQTLEA